MIPRRLSLLTSLLAGATLAAPLTAEPAPPAPTQAPAAAPAVTITTVDQLLDALEKADRGIRTLHADVVYDRQFELQGDRHVRFGELLFQTEAAAADAAPPRRTFQLALIKLFVDGREQEENTRFTFDGEWLAEDNAVAKTWTRRRIAPPGANFDPFRVGAQAAILPLPIGQRKEDILSVYTAQLAEPIDGLTDEPRYAEYVKDAYQLVLKPHNPDDRSNQFREVRLWYEKGKLLPLMSRVVNRAGDDSIVQLVNVRVNAPDFSHERLKIEPPGQGSGYRVQIIDTMPGDEDPGRRPVPTAEPAGSEGARP